MAMPRRVSAVIAGIDAKEVERILEEEIGQICVELSGFRGIDVSTNPS